MHRFYMLPKIIFCIGIMLFLCSCNTKNKIRNNENAQHLLMPEKEMEFNTGYPVRHKFNGTYYDKKDSTEYIYFADPVTFKEINFFTFNGTLQWKVPLDSMVEETDIDMISVVSPDTIIGLDDHLNTLYFLNSKGRLWKKIDMNPMLDSLGLINYELGESMFNDFLLTDSTFIFATATQYDYSGIAKNISLTDEYKILWQRQNNRYIIAKLELKDSGMKLTVGLEKFYGSDTVVRMYWEPGFYYTGNAAILWVSKYKNVIFEINPLSLQINKEYPVKSDFTAIGFSAPVVSNETIGKHGDSFNLKVKTSGSINSIYYDKYANQYLVGVMHTVSETLPDSLTGGARSWSLIVYDKNFNKLDEIYFAGMTYIQDIIPLKQGILINNNLPQDANYDKTKSRYMLFKRKN